ncbi:type II toxin-antitoxin system HicB family antitoxin [Pelistega suis]|uniref:type II toxin-antitoxin system HicB family antitoxin n=1 Tax=Pelistega suis TaxID=1631957 RepID=UPI00211C25C9|nr:type II toxin-antitoxin system HicB family antitoxin [Pelistega suis]MCQ9328641.1 type II toxin-antitoxin system HicB family antitoxin [Pelistega suis]
MMLFTVGIETPKSADEAFGIVVPVLCSDEYSCFSAADTIEQIHLQAIDAIYSLLDEMLADGINLLNLKDLGFSTYRELDDFKHCDAWLLLEVDISGFFGKRQRVNVVLPQYLIDRIDQRVLTNPAYQDRSHFLTIASQHELAIPSI